MPVRATPWANTNSAAAEMMRVRVAKPFAVNFRAAAGAASTTAPA